jgi:transglutaminase-like putative cysteine protease
MNKPVRFRVTHTTEYQYSDAVSGSWQLAHLTPRVLDWQKLNYHQVDVDPTPFHYETAIDYFGNTVTRFNFHGAHSWLRVNAVSDVTLLPHAPVLADVASPSWEKVRDIVHSVGLVPHSSDHGLNEAQAFCLPSVLAPTHITLKNYALSSFSAQRPWFHAVYELMQRIHADFTFDTMATSVSTPVLQVLQQRRGVCQDFAHLMIASLRSLGLPARYMSGYIQTFAQPGAERMQGADASHAWVAAYCPGLGWIEFDPTNAKLADTEFITLSWGRDFSDITPLRGVILGGGTQTLKVRVSVEPHLESLTG